MEELPAAVESNLDVRSVVLIYVVPMLTACGQGPSEDPSRLQYEPSPSVLTETYGIRPEESARRLNNEQYVSELSTRLASGALPDWSSIWIQHEPNYAVVVAFARPPAKEDLLRLAAPPIRNDLLIVTAKRTAAEIARDQDRISSAFQDAPTAWSGGYNVKNQKFEYSAGTSQGASLLKTRVPTALRGDVVISVGPQPVPL